MGYYFWNCQNNSKISTKFGAWNRVNEPWYVQLMFPLIKSKDERSELHSLIQKDDYDPSINYKEYTK